MIVPTPGVPVRVNWKAAMLAPLLVPFIMGGLSAVTGAFSPGHALFGFLFLFIPASVVAYATMFCLFLPALRLTARVMRLTLPRVSLLGAVLGTLAYLPLLWQAWKSSGTDSGPPEEPFIDFAVRFSADLLTLIFPVAGLITAAAYWYLAARPRQVPR